MDRPPSRNERTHRKISSRLSMAFLCLSMAFFSTHSMINIFDESIMGRRRDRMVRPSSLPIDSFCQSVGRSVGPWVGNVWPTRTTRSDLCRACGLGFFFTGDC